MSTSPARRPNGTIMPGYSLNPGGKAKGIERRIREYIEAQVETLDGKVMDGWDYMFACLYAIATGRSPPGNIDGAITAKDRMAASMILLDRVYGKAKIQIETDTTLYAGGLKNLDIDNLSAEELDALEAHVELLSAKAQGKATSNIIDVAPADIVETETEPDEG